MTRLRAFHRMALTLVNLVTLLSLVVWPAVASAEQRNASISQQTPTPGRAAAVPRKADRALHLAREVISTVDAIVTTCLDASTLRRAATRPRQLPRRHPHKRNRRTVLTGPAARLTW